MKDYDKQTFTVYNTPRNHEVSQKHPQAPPHEADKPLGNDPDPSS